MGAPAPSAQDFFGSTPDAKPPAALPTPEQFFASSEPQSGAAHDTVWSSLQSAGARILDSVGYGFKDNWGARPLGLDSDTEGALRKAGVINDYQAGHDTFIKSANEALIRQAADFADLAARTPAAILGAISGGAKQTAQEIQGEQGEVQGSNTVRGLLAQPVGALGEAAEEVAGGALGEAPALTEAGRVPEAAETVRVTDAAKARSIGVVGEGEAGYYGAEPLTPENVAARTNAAEDAGIEPPPPEPPAPDIHAIARRIDPETFDQYDALALERDQHRQTLATLGAERDASPEAAAAKTEIDEIIGGGSGGERESRIDAVRASAPDAVIKRLDAAQARLEAALTTDTPAMIEVRNQLLNADFAMRDLAPQVAQAYRQAQDITPPRPEIAPEVPGAPGEAEPAATPAERAAAAATAKPEGAAEAPEGQPQPFPAAIGAEAAEEAGIAPPSVTGAQTLGEGGGAVETAQERPAGASVAGEEGIVYQGKDSTFTHNGEEYSVDKTLEATAHAPIVRTKLDELDWIFEHSQPDLQRAGRVNTATPIIFTEENGQKIILDGLHRLSKAKLQGNETIASRFISSEDLRRARVGASALDDGAKPPTARYGNLRATEGTGGTATRSLSEGVEAKAIEDGLTSTFGDLPEYRQLSMADQAAKASDLINSDYETAKAVAMGDRQPPKGLLPESVFVAVEKRALAEGDVDTLRQLATRSRLATAATTMGQRIRTLGERDPASPVGAIQDIQKAREADVAKRVDIAAATRETVEEIRAEVRSAAPKPAAWEDFLATIRCEG